MLLASISWEMPQKMGEKFISPSKVPSFPSLCLGPRPPQLSLHFKTVARVILMIVLHIIHTATRGRFPSNVEV